MLHRAVLLVLLALFAGLASCSTTGGSAVPRPNIVFILADDLGWADLGCMGSTLHETPVLDGLAKEGVRFTNAYASCALCSPTRASILTGKYPATLCLTDFIAGRDYPFAKLRPPKWTPYLDLEEQTLPERLKRAGYTTAMIGKWHLGGRKHAAGKHGFDVNLGGTHLGYPPSYHSPYGNKNLKDGPEGEYLTDRLSREACAFIRVNRERPFFVYLSYFSVHLPIQPRADKLVKYVAKIEAEPPAPKRQKNPHYAAMVESIDDGVGEVLRTLKELSLERDTLVVFTSDNGGLSTLEGPHTPATTNFPLRGGKGQEYEGGIRVPCIVRWPGRVPAGGVRSEPISSIDWAPTMIEASGLLPDGFIDGVSLLPVLRDPTAMLDRDALYWHYPHYSRQGGRPHGAVRAGKFKLVEHYETGDVELFDLSADPGEAKDLAGSMPGKASELRGLLDGWRRKVGAGMPSPNPNYDPQRPFRGARWIPVEE